ncbi:MAG: hypothetical protein WCT18_01820 [Patescibacteria group bacterium]
MKWLWILLIIFFANSCMVLHDYDPPVYRRTMTVPYPGNYRPYYSGGYYQNHRRPPPPKKKGHPPAKKKVADGKKKKPAKKAVKRR